LVLARVHAVLLGWAAILANEFPGQGTDDPPQTIRSACVDRRALVAANLFAGLRTDDLAGTVLAFGAGVVEYDGSDDHETDKSDQGGAQR